MLGGPRCNGTDERLTRPLFMATGCCSNNRVKVLDVLELEDVLTEADVGAGCERMGCSTVDGDRRLEARQL